MGPPLARTIERLLLELPADPAALNALLGEALRRPDGHTSLRLLLRLGPAHGAELEPLVRRVVEQGLLHRLVRQVAGRPDPLLGMWLHHHLRQVSRWDEHEREREALHGFLAGWFLVLLRRVERGQLTVSVPVDPRTSVGYQPFPLSNGWTPSVYNRVFCWHYIHTFTSPHGLVFDLLDHDRHPRVRQVLNYEPPPEVLTRVYGFAG